VLTALLALAGLAAPLHSQGGAVKFGLSAAYADGGGSDGGSDGGKDSAQGGDDSSNDQGGDDGSDGDRQDEGSDGGNERGDESGEDPDEVDASAPSDDSEQTVFPPLGGLAPLN